MATRSYTQLALREALCVACRERRAAHQWTVNVCATGNRKEFVAVCTPCDIAFNDQTLAFINHPRREKLMADYRKSREVKA